MDFLKTIFEWADLADHSTMPLLLFQAMKVRSDFIDLKTPVKLTMSPFKHYFGEMSVTAEVLFHGILSRPGVRLTIELPGFDKTLEKLREANVAAPKLITEISEALGEYAAWKKNGDAFLEIVNNPDQPGEIFINGK